MTSRRQMPRAQNDWGAAQKLFFWPEVRPLVTSMRSYTHKLKNRKLPPPLFQYAPALVSHSQRTNG